MNNYYFQLMQNGNLVGEGFGDGNSAMEAFELAVSSGSVFLRSGEEVQVIATCENGSGLGLSFGAFKA